jgi:nucleoside-diphosphate-sugar epimerase
VATLVKLLVTGDVEAARDVGYRPSTDLETGVKHFVEWYLAYYRPPFS